MVHHISLKVSALKIKESCVELMLIFYHHLLHAKSCFEPVFFINTSFLHVLAHYGHPQVIHLLHI
jgi:hypothetical protein